MRRLLFSVLTSIAFCWNANAQSLDQTLTMADSLLQQKRFEESVRAYERVLFFAPDNLKNRAQIGLGRAYFGTGDYKRSADAYSSATDITETDSGTYGIM